MTVPTRSTVLSNESTVSTPVASAWATEKGLGEVEPGYFIDLESTQQ